jgi:hypothetical protein
MASVNEGENGVYTTENVDQLLLISVIRLDPSNTWGVLGGSTILVLDQQSRASHDK